MSSCWPSPQGLHLCLPKITEGISGRWNENWTNTELHRECAGASTGTSWLCASEENQPDPVKRDQILRSWEQKCHHMSSLCKRAGKSSRSTGCFFQGTWKRLTSLLRKRNESPHPPKGDTKKCKDLNAPKRPRHPASCHVLSLNPKSKETTLAYPPVMLQGSWKRPRTSLLWKTSSPVRRRLPSWRKTRERLLLPRELKRNLMQWESLVRAERARKRRKGMMNRMRKMMNKLVLVQFFLLVYEAFSPLYKTHSC